MQIKRIKTCVIIVFLLWTMVYGLWTSNAGVPHLINYQARLVDKDGRALDGRYKVTLGIYDAATGGAGLWEETRESIDIEDGMLSVMLGDVTAFNLAFDKDYYLQIKVGDEVLGPRQRITSAGYAIKAERADTAAQAVNASTVAGYSVSAGDTAAPGKIPVMNASGYLPDNSVDISALKTATGEVSYTGIFGSIGANRTLPGGMYGFYPQIKNSTTEINNFTLLNGWYGYSIGITSTSYVTNIFLGPLHETGQTQYAKQCYITASGVDYWLFVLTDKKTKETISVWGAPDHPAYGNGGDFEKMPHPFSDFNATTQEINLVCNDSVTELKSLATTEKSIVSLVNEDYRVDFREELKYTPIHSGQFLGGAPVMVEDIPGYITVRRIVRLTEEEKRDREERGRGRTREYQAQKAREEQKKRAAIGKLEKLGLSEDDIRVIVQE